MKYHIFKQSRMYSGRPYRGPSWKGAKVPAETSNFTRARWMVVMMTRINPVGWDIYDSTSGERVG